MALSEAIDEIRSARNVVYTQKNAENAGEPAPRKREKKPKSKAEIEAYRQKKMREEEERYLGKAEKPPRKRRAKSVEAPHPAETAQEPCVKRKRRHSAQDGDPAAPKVPAMLQPLQPLYLLKIPGLVKGDCLAICLVHGVES